MSTTSAWPGAPAESADLPPATARDRASLALLLVASAVLYLANITANGMANTFYSGSVWAGTQNWEALLFGSVDPSNFITVDKPPLSQWIMGLSGRLFGFSAASMLIPEALLGVASVALVYGLVTRLSGRRAGLIAGAALAVTPVADLMFRYDNPDAAMVFCTVAAAYCVVRAAQKANGWWLALAGVAMGAAFLAKMLEGLMCLPALIVLYLIAAPTGWGRKIRQLLGALAALAVSAGWYVVVTIVWPAADRPYLAGSTDNSFLNLAFGYNGFSRVQGRTGTGADRAGAASTWAGQAAGTRTGAAGMAGGAMGGSVGPFRLFTGEFGLEIGWLIPAALVALIAVLVLRRKQPWNDLVRAGALMAGIWLVVAGAVLSFMQGTTHAYYTLAIAPAIAILVGLGFDQAWRARESVAGSFSLAAITLGAGGFSTWMLATQASGWMPWLAGFIGVLTLVAALAFVAGRGHTTRRVGSVVLGAALVSALGAPAALAANADTSSHTGGSPSVAPRESASSARGAYTGTRDAGSAGSGFTRTRSGANASTSGASDGSAGTASGSATPRVGRAAGGSATGRTGSATGGASSSASTSAGAGGFAGGQEQTADDPALDSLLETSHDTWAAAVTGTSSASALELQARVPVMGIGGFTGTDPTPTLAQFQADVKAGKVGYYVVSGSGTGFGGGRGGSGGVGTQIQTWVEATYTAKTVGTATVYDLSTPKAG